jgi:hypothetical protein
MAPDHLPEILEWKVHVLGDAGDGKVTGTAAFPELEPWVLRFEARAVNGRLVITELTVTFAPNPFADEAATYPPLGISSGVLGRVRLGALSSALHARVNQAHSDVAELAKLLAAGNPVDSPDPNDRLIRDAVGILDELTDDVRPRRRGNPGHPPSYLRRVAEVRLQVEAEGVRPINAAVADRLGLPSPERARDHVSRATRAEWLAEGDAGRSQRVPGPKLLAARASELPPDESNRSSQTDGRDNTR